MARVDACRKRCLAASETLGFLARLNQLRKSRGAPDDPHAWTSSNTSRRASAPASFTRLPARLRFCRRGEQALLSATAVFNAAAMALAPLSLMLLLRRSTDRIVAIAGASVTAPSSPKRFPHRFRRVKTPGLRCARGQARDGVWGRHGERVFYTLHGN